ncbi:MAG: hypothetical protein JKY01_08990 [Pseudomonadales bacterium]|nr:hypothetical protein [Pseudomonadales bacterium]
MRYLFLFILIYSININAANTFQITQSGSSSDAQAACNAQKGGNCNQLSNTSVCNADQGAFWWSTGSSPYIYFKYFCFTNIEQTPQEICIANDNYWYNDVCNDLPQTVASFEEQCISQSKYWYNDVCNNLPQTVASFEEQCISQSKYWYNDVCNNLPQDFESFECSTGTESPSAFWSTNYPNGVTKLWEDQKLSFEEQPVLDVLDLSLPSTGSSLSYEFCFNLASEMNYGCKTMTIADYVLAFIRLCIIITAAWTCRALIFGG